MLIRVGADRNARTTFGFSPLMFAADGGQGAAVATLLAAGARVDARGTREATVLHVAARLGDAETVHRLLDAGADPNVLNESLQTPLARWRGEKNDTYCRLNDVTRR